MSARGRCLDPVVAEEEDEEEEAGGTRLARRRRRAPPRGERGREPAPVVATRTPAQLQQLIDDIVAAIAANEVGGASVAMPSRMGTSSGVPASYASATQMIASHAIGVLRGAGADAAEAHGISPDDLRAAHDVDSAVRQVWRILVEEQGDPASVPARLRSRAHLTDDDLAKMVQFGRVRARLLAARPEFPARIAAVSAALRARADATLATLAALGPAAHETDEAASERDETDEADETEETVETAEPTAGAPTIDAGALDELLGTRPLRALAPLRGVRPPAAFARWPEARRARWVAGQRRLIERAAGRIESLADTAAATLLAREVSSDPDAQSLDLSEADIRAYIHDGDFNRFGEDRAAWIRVGLRQTAEAGGDGASSRSLDDGIASAVEADGGWELSRAEYAHWIRQYVERHPAAEDEQVVRAAAAHNGHSRQYPDRILANYRRIVGGRAPAVAPTSDPPMTTTLR